MTKQPNEFWYPKHSKGENGRSKKLSAEKRETKRTLLLLITTATMDVDSDDDDEIIAERGTSACILIFSRRARAYILLFLSFHHLRRRRKERRRSLRAKTTDNTTGRSKIRTRFWARRNFENNTWRRLRAKSIFFCLSSWLLLLVKVLSCVRGRKREEERMSVCLLSLSVVDRRKT